MGLGEVFAKLCAGDTEQNIPLGDSDGMGFGETVQRVEIGVCVTLAVSDAAWVGEAVVKEMGVTLGVWEEDGLGGIVSGVDLMMNGVILSVGLGETVMLGVIDAVRDVSLGTSEELTGLDGVEGLGVEDSDDVWLGDVVLKVSDGVSVGETVGSVMLVGCGMETVRLGDANWRLDEGEGLSLRKKVWLGELLCNVIRGVVKLVEVATGEGVADSFMDVKGVMVVEGVTEDIKGSVAEDVLEGVKEDMREDVKEGEI